MNITQRFTYAMHILLKTIVIVILCYKIKPLREVYNILIEHIHVFVLLVFL
jgi:hypothetical protein